jgi:HEAT repeat protein
MEGSSDSTQRKYAAITLGKLGDPRAFQPLVKALGDSDLRGAAAEALGKLRDPRAVEPLIRALADLVPTAAEALGELADARAVEPLIEALEHPPVFRQAIKALRKFGKLNNVRAVDRLINALHGYFGTDDAIKALRDVGKLDDPRAVEALVRALRKGCWSERRAAAEALVSLARTTPQVIISQWGEVSRLVKEPHIDTPQSAGRYIEGFGYCGGGASTGRDTGIGLDFPEPPASGTNAKPDF